jgi:hypothetical protein
MAFAPGEVKRFAQTWDQTHSDGTVAPPGKYEAVGMIPVRVPGTTSGPVAFSIR